MGTTRNGGRTTGRPPADRQRLLLARLGLDDRATPEDVADTHDELVAFLTTAPKPLRAWARTQAAAADEAFALLTDPDAATVPGALPGPVARPTVQPDEPATPPARRAPSTGRTTAAAEADMVAAAEPSFEEMLAEVTPGTHRESLAKPGSARAPRPSSTTSATLETPDADGSRRGSGVSVRRVALAGAALVGIVAVAFGGYQLGAAPSTAANLQASPAPQASPAVDQALVADLMAKVAADPKDVDAMLQLGDAFYRGEDFGAAVTWFGKALDVDGTSVRARLALGAAYFNLGDMAGAETAWLAVVKQDPKNVEAHYDLGFLFLNRDPADMDGVRREWGEVVRLAPDSDVAKTVKAHLDALAPSAAPSGTPGPAASGAASTAPSAVPSASPVQP